MAAFLDFKYGNIPAELAVALRAMPGYNVAGGTRFKILAESDIFPYDKVQFETGPVKDRVAWIAKGTFRDGRFDWP
jgi:hypothetical protein